jgi:hypothetical protein
MDVVWPSEGFPPGDALTGAGKAFLEQVGGQRDAVKRPAMTRRPLVAALFVDQRGAYASDPRCDCWDERRDARRYSGPIPVVAHPPCASWCQLAGLRQAVYGYPKGEDDGCFESALLSLRQWGGVLEHPAYSTAFRRFGIVAPRASAWQYNIAGYWVCAVNQAAYGHRATKRTWLLYIGCNPPAPLNWARTRGCAVVSGSHNHCDKPIGQNARVWSAEASRTPPAFAEALIQLAANCGGPARARAGTAGGLT